MPPRNRATTPPARPLPARAKLTIREIAREAGVSIATVSRALNEPDKVRPETRDRILAIARDRHYVSDALAASLVSRRSRMIGVMIPTIVNSIYASFTQAIQRACQAAGYSVLIGITEYSPETENELVTRLLERRVDGLLLTGIDRRADVYAKIERLGVPFVATWHISDRPAVPSVSFDNYRAACTAMEHLIGLGHRRIALLCGRTVLNDRALERRRAYLECLQRYGLDADPNLVEERDFEFTEGHRAMQRILDSRPLPTAVFSANDILAVGAIHACRDRGLRVPDDLSVIGFDDHPITEHVTPRLTTIRVPAYEMGDRATRALVRAIASGDRPESVRLETELVIRESTAPPSRRRRRRR